MFHNRNKIILHLIYKKEREGEGERERERERENEFHLIFESRQKFQSIFSLFFFSLDLQYKCLHATFDDNNQILKVTDDKTAIDCTSVSRWTVLPSPSLLHDLVSLSRQNCTKTENIR